MSATVTEIVLADWACAECGVSGGEPMLKQWADKGAADHDEEFHTHVHPEGEDA